MKGQGFKNSLITCGVGFSLSPCLWWEVPFCDVADSETNMSFSSMEGILLTVAVENFWVLSDCSVLEQMLLPWQRATSHFFFEARKLESSNTHEEYLLHEECLLRRSLCIFEVCSRLGKKKHLESKGQSPSLNRPPPIHAQWPWELSLNAVTFQSYLLLISWQTNTKIPCVWA